MRRAGPARTSPLRALAPLFAPALALLCAACAPERRLLRTDLVQSQKLRVLGPGGGTLRASDGGPANALTPVLFVHGMGGRLEYWEPQLAHLRRTRRAAALDLRGHGDSSTPDKPDDYSPAAMAQDVGAVADKLGLTRFVLVGHSLGGSVASEYAALHPERVAGLLLVDASGDLRKAPREDVDAVIRTLRGPQARDFLERMAKQGCGQTDEALREARAGFAQVQPQAAAAFVEGALQYDPAATLSRYPGPRLLVYGDKDALPYTLQNVAPPEVQRLQIDAGHCLNLAAPGRFDAALDEFLSRVDAAAPAPPRTVPGAQGALRVE